MGISCHFRDVDLSLVLLSAPAVQHRLMRPLANRPLFKRLATRQIVLGSATLATALVLATQLVLSAVFGHSVGNVIATLVATSISLLWWLLPRLWKSAGRL